MRAGARSTKTLLGPRTRAADSSRWPFTSSKTLVGTFQTRDPQRPAVCDFFKSPSPHFEISSQIKFSSVLVSVSQFPIVLPACRLPGSHATLPGGKGRLVCLRLCAAGPPEVPFPGFSHLFLRVPLQELYEHINFKSLTSSGVGVKNSVGIFTEIPWTL